MDILIYVTLCLSIILLIGSILWWHPPGFLHTFNLAELIPDALLIVDKNGVILKANKNAEHLFGYSKSELYKMHVEDLIPERFRELHRKHRSVFQKDKKPRPMGMGRDLLILTKDGREIPTEIALSPASQTMLSNYCRQKIIVLLHDVTVRKEYENTIHNLAYYNQLTGLPNRVWFYKEAQDIIDNITTKKHNLAFVLIDIRELKKINDSMGHYVGDDVIKRTSIILKEIMNDYKNKYIVNMHLFNTSGNEFVYLLEYIAEGRTQCIIDFLTYVIDIFKSPAMIKGQSIDMHINVNMGVSISPIHGITISQLMKTTDIALIKSKQQGKNCFSFYNDILNTEFHNFIAYENAINYFIDTKDFEIVYQPVWSIKKEQFVGAEVLFRCNEDLYPNMHVELLINVAESTGLVVQLGQAILERVCEENLKYNLTCNGFVLSVNASIQQMEDNTFADMVIGILKKSGADPKGLAIEITETTLMNSETKAIEQVNKLRNFGVLIYIDDFGKGFSSLSYLQKIPADKLKIDISFLDGIEYDSSRSEIVRGIIDLGHAIEMVVCAEGVENQTQLSLLENLGCDEVQGFYKGTPITAVELQKLYVEIDENYAIPDNIEQN